MSARLRSPRSLVPLVVGMTPVCRLAALVVLVFSFVANTLARAEDPGPAIEKPATRPTTRPVPTPAEAMKKGVAFLVRSQNADGSWGTGKETRGFEIYSMVPGSLDAFRVATSALCVMALRDAGETTAHDKGLTYLLNAPPPRRDDGQLIYTTWAHIYAIQALAIEMRHSQDPRIKTALIAHLKRLGEYETFMGGWNYYDFQAETVTPSMGPTSFGTAAGLVALWEAKQSGIEIPQKMIDRALNRLAETRLPNGAYLYGSDYKYTPRLPANQPRGSVGRTQACNYALWLWGRKEMDETKVRDGLDMFFREHNYIEMGRKRQFPHEAWYQTAPYYYYFGHYYTAKLIEKLDGTDHGEQGKKLLDVGILPQQDADGAWWDFPMWDFDKPYGTAFAIMTIARSRS